MIEPPAGSFDLDERAVDLCASATEHGAVLVRRSGIAEPADLARFGRATGPGADTEAWEWDHQSRLTGHTDRNGRETTYGWDDGSNLTAIGYPGTGTLTRSFDDAGRLALITDWDGRTTSFTWDANSNWTQTTFPSASQNTDHYSYDQADRMTGVDWKRAGVSLGSLSYAPRDAKGMVTAVTAAGSATKSTSWGYDARAQLTTDGSEAFAYDPAGNLIENADGTLRVFDPAQRLCWTSPTATGGTCTTPAADATTYDYDASGNRTSKVLPSGTGSTFGYDAENRMTTATVPDVVSPETNQLHLLAPARIADTSNGTGTCDGIPCTILDANDPVEVTVAGVGGVPASGAVAVTGTITAIGPDGDGSISINPNGAAAAGAVIAIDGDTTTAAFTAQLVGDELIVEADVDTDMAIDITGYFAAPNPFALAANYWSVTPEVIVETGNGTGTCDGNPCATLTAGETEIDVTGFTGYPAGGATAITVSVLASTSGTAGTLRVNPNGTAAAGEISWDSTFAMGTGQFTVPVSGTGTITLEASTATDVTVSVNGYWKAPSSGQDLGTGLTPLDGGAARLVDTRDGTGTCNNSPCDTIVGFAAAVEIPTAGQAGIPAEATAIVASVTAHDPAGVGLVGLTSTSGGGGIAITHPAAGTSATVIVPINPDTGAIYLGAWSTTDVTIDISGYFTRPTTTYEYEYGIGGIRTAKHRTSGYATTTEYTWTAASGLPLLLAEHTGTKTTNIIYGPGGTPLYQTNTAGDLLYYHQDHQGSTRLITNSNGTTRGAITYNAYGKLASSTVGWLQQQPLLTYTGEYADSETGYIYLRARYYDPMVGQFTTQDPIVGTSDEAYGYGLNNPQNMVDPTGLIGFSIGPVKVGDGCPLGKNPGGGCRGADTARKVATHPILQTAVVVAGCTAGPGGCAAANAAVVSVNGYYRYRDEGGFTTNFVAGTALDIGLTAIPMKGANSIRGELHMVNPMTTGTVFRSTIGRNRGVPSSLVAKLIPGNIRNATLAAVLSNRGNRLIRGDSILTGWGELLGLGDC